MLEVLLLLIGLSSLKTTTEALDYVLLRLLRGVPERDILSDNFLLHACFLFSYELSHQYRYCIVVVV